MKLREPVWLAPPAALEEVELEATKPGSIMACEPSLRRSMGTSFFLSCFSFSKRARLSSSGFTNKRPDSSSSCLSLDCSFSDRRVVYFLISGSAGACIG